MLVSQQNMTEEKSKMSLCLEFRKGEKNAESETIIPSQLEGGELKI